MQTMDRIGRYQILQELGRGAMGVVYKALDPQIDRTVAIKMILTSNLPPAQLENYKQRFYSEARAAGKMSHGGIVTIYDITEDSTGQPCLVMEFVEGRTLDQVMSDTAARGERLLVAQALDIAIQIADALDFAHRRGVVHRDVKPANILLTSEAIAKIADFGIAKMDGVQLTQTGHMLGTPAFMSPEQFSGGAVDARSDLFSLGSILYWLLSGEKPFHADTMSMVTYKVVFADPPPPTQIHPALPRDADLVLARCLAKKPDARYASCKDLAEDLRALVVGKPVKATALSTQERTVIAPPAVPSVDAANLEKTVAQPAPLAGQTVAAPQKPALASTRAVEPPAQPAAKKSYFFSRGWIAAAVVILILLLAGAAWLMQRPASTTESRVSPPAQQVAQRHAAAPSSRPSAPPVEKHEPAKPEPEKQEPVAAPPVLQHEEDQPERETKGPPAWAKGKGRRNRASAASGATATLRIECAHNFPDGVLEITSGGQQILRASLRGEDQGMGVVKIYRGLYQNSFEIPAGEHVLEVRVRSSRSNYDETDEIGGAFPGDGARTLLIEFGRGSGIGVIGRKLTLRWKSE